MSGFPRRSSILGRSPLRLPLVSVLLVSISLISAATHAGEVYSSFPEKVAADEKYVFYSHGFIVEGDDPRPVHPTFGVYDFPAVKIALADPSYNLIAYHREAGTDPNEFAIRIAADVGKLVDAGVEISNITLMGFSRGGFITALASHRVASDEFSTILLAACSGWVERSDIQIRGDLLSIHESSDEMASSCDALAAKSSQIGVYRELVISTGKQHGAFYTPLPSWITPVKRWIQLDSAQRERAP